MRPTEREIRRKATLPVEPVIRVISPYLKFNLPQVQTKLNHFSKSWCVSISALKGLDCGTVYLDITYNDIIGFPAARWAESKNI